MWKYNDDGISFQMFLYIILSLNCCFLPSSCKQRKCKWKDLDIVTLSSLDLFKKHSQFLHVFDM